METTHEEFLDAAEKEFGNKIKISDLSNLPIEDITKENAKFGTDLTVSDFAEYGKHAWTIENKCPKCGKDLDGLFGTFFWGICHGYGNCSECGCEFKYYHYIGKSEIPIKMFALTGF